MFFHILALPPWFCTSNDRRLRFYWGQSYNCRPRGGIFSIFHACDWKSGRKFLTIARFLPGCNISYPRKWYPASLASSPNRIVLLPSCFTSAKLIKLYKHPNIFELTIWEVMSIKNINLIFPWFLVEGEVSRNEIQWLAHACTSSHK